MEEKLYVLLGESLKENKKLRAANAQLRADLDAIYR